MQIQGWEEAQVRQTHISTVLIGADRVLKLKKPVSFGFLDFTTLEQRRDACEAEAHLNERTAPGVTLGVRRLTAAGGGPGGDGGVLEVEGSGALVDYAVEMQRLPDERRMASLLQRGELTTEHVDQVAEWLAGFHAASPRCAPYGSPEAVSALIEENFEQTPGADASMGPEQATRAREFQRELIASGWVQRRLEAGRVRDGHGDLRLDHVYLLGDLGAPRIVAIDGIEFSPRYRCADVASDLAFLAMELLLHGASALSERLIARWALQSGDWEVYGVVDRYMAYRAWVRAKIRGLQGDERAAHQRYELAHRIATRQRSRVLVAVGGPIASGKSTLADALSFALEAPVIDADRTRKQLAGVEPEVSLGSEPFAGAYTEAATEVVYAELARRAALVLDSGRTVVLDASFRSEAVRRYALQAAFAAGVACPFVLCSVPIPLLRQRLEARTGGASDARAPLLDDFLARYEPPVGPGVLEVDTSGPVDLEPIVAFVSAQATPALDEHREVRRLILRLRSGEREAVGLLAALLPGHFEYEERPGGFFDLARAKGAPAEADRLQAQHAPILEAVHALLDCWDDAGAEALATLLERHEHDEAVLSATPDIRRRRGW